MRRDSVASDRQEYLVPAHSYLPSVPQGLVVADAFGLGLVAGIVTYLILQKCGANKTWAFLTGIVAVIVIRLLAVGFGWQLPVFGTAQT
jgi:hypothetical protein